MLCRLKQFERKEICQSLKLENVPLFKNDITGLILKDPWPDDQNPTPERVWDLQYRQSALILDLNEGQKPSVTKAPAWSPCTITVGIVINRADRAKRAQLASCAPKIKPRGSSESGLIDLFCLAGLAKGRCVGGGSRPKTDLSMP